MGALGEVSGTRRDALVPSVSQLTLQKKTTLSVKDLNIYTKVIGWNFYYRDIQLKFQNTTI